MLWFLPPNGRNKSNHVPSLWQLRHKQVTERQQGWPRSYSWARCGIDTKDSTSGDNQLPGSDAHCHMQLTAEVVTVVFSLGQFCNMVWEIIWEV